MPVPAAGSTEGSVDTCAPHRRGPSSSVFSVWTARATAPLTKRTSAVSPSGSRRTATVERQVNQLLDVFGWA